MYKHIENLLEGPYIELFARQKVSGWDAWGNEVISFTVSGTDLNTNAYAGTDSITFNIDTSTPTLSLGHDHGDLLLILSDTFQVSATFSESMTISPSIKFLPNLIISEPMNGSGAAWNYTKL